MTANRHHAQQVMMHHFATEWITRKKDRDGLRSEARGFILGMKSEGAEPVQVAKLRGHWLSVTGHELGT